MEGRETLKCIWREGEEEGGLEDNCQISDTVGNSTLRSLRRRSKFLVGAQYTFRYIEFVVSRLYKGSIL